MNTQRVMFLSVLLAGACIAPPQVLAAVSEEQAAVRQFAKLAQARFYRQASVVLENVGRFARMDESTLTLHDRFLRAFYEGRWEELRTLLEGLSEEQSDLIYNKMLDDMTGRFVPLLTLDDFLGLADASPKPLGTEQIHKLGQLLRVAVAKEQELWLKQALEKGSRRLGRDKAKKLATGRILAKAGFDELARAYLPNSLEAAQITDTDLRTELMTFLASQEEIQEDQQKQIAKLWKEKAALLADAGAEWSQRQKAADRLTDLLGRASAASIEPWIRNLMRDDIEGGLLLATTLGKNAPTKNSDTDIALRTNNLKIEKCVLLSAAEHADLAKVPWSQVAMAMTDWWIHEAEHSTEQHASSRSGKSSKPHVAPEDVLDAAPSGAWAKALPATLRERVDVCLSRTVLVSDRYEEAVSLIIEIAHRNPKAGVTLAEEYLKAWAERHDPAIPEEIRKKHQLPDDARIAVTPLMMEKNIESLAKMMDLLRQSGIQPRNGPLLVGAFAVCYSNAEVYRKSHIEKVFGPVDDMAEDIFFQIIHTMTEGLSSRWRKIELQKEAGTRRTQSETLQMVRDGYQGAIEMIDQRAAKHPDAWRILVLGGSLMSDWGDFEYYQELAAETKIQRMEAFREKNCAAEEYFTKAAQAYARQVAKGGRGGTSIDVYLAWFHSLLGVNTNGDLNLSKPLDRRALGKIRDMIRSLPGNAAQAHLDKLAKYVSARLEDTKQPLHEEIKYKYLAGSLVITQQSPFSFEASSKVNYYDELLKEIHLTTRADGPSTIHRDQQFGIILSIQHTEAMGRMADFGKYLVNETLAAAPNNAWQKKKAAPVIAVHKMGEAKGRRDELELNIREALSLFFDIQSITFSPRDVQPRPTERPGWKETVLAYIDVKAKDCSVDKIPRVQMNLEFLDLAGPVSISAESAETMIKITDQPTPPRPFYRVDLTEILDSRNLASTEEALLEITATASGLVPELDQIVDLGALRGQLPIARVDQHEGTRVREVNSWGDTVHAVSERRWTVVLDASSLMKPPRRILLSLPAPKLSDASVKYRLYQDMDLVDLAEPAALLGTAGEVAADPQKTAPAWVPYVAIGAPAAGVLLLALAIVRVVRRRSRRLVRARDVFHMPARIDGFILVQLLRALAASPLVRLSEAQRAEMQHQIEQLQRNCFAGNGNGSGPSEDELRRVARLWLKIAGCNTHYAPRDAISSHGL